MSVFAEGAPVTAFTCNGLPVEKVDSFRYLGLHFHKSGDVVHLIEPIKHKAAGSWAAVQRRHSLLQCGSTVNIHLQLLQSIYWCLLYTMVARFGACTVQMQAEPNGLVWTCRRFVLFYLRVVCGLSSSTPRSMLQSWEFCLYKSFSGVKPCAFGTP